jgi:sulfatase modifying factor 1
VPRRPRSVGESGKFFPHGHPDVNDLDLVDLPGGHFRMGSHAGCARADERPAHPVEVSPFAIARHAVTNGEYAEFLAATGAPAPGAWTDPRFYHPEQPVVAVSWFEAVSFCEWLTRRHGSLFRLPTEAEREYACRAGSAAEYPWGETAERETADYGRRWVEGPEVVGGPANGFGLWNMADNVHEWCLDWYGADYYRTSPGLDPRGPTAGARRASRGGSWRHQIKVTRSSARSALDPSYRYTDYGFRVVRVY